MEATRRYAPAGFLLAVGISLIAIWSVLEYRNRQAIQVSDTSAARRSRECGPLSLRVAANLLGIACSRPQVLEICRPGPFGTEVKDLLKSARELGLHGEVKTLSWDELKFLDGTAILHVNGYHYVVANPREASDSHANSIRIYDPSRSTRWLTQKELDDIWSGVSLILRPDPAYRNALPIATKSFWIDQGVFAGEDEAEFHISISNVSETPLRLAMGPTGCNCSEATVDENRLKPGEETQIHASIRLRGRRGGFRDHISLLVENADEDDVQSKETAIAFTLAGTVLEDDLLSAKRIFLGHKTHLDFIEQSFVVFDPGNGDLKEVEPMLRDSCKGIDTSLIPVRITEGNRNDFPDSRRLLEGDWVVTIQGKITEEASFGDFSTPIVVRTNLSAPHDKLFVSMEGSVSPPISVEPPALILAVEPNRQTKKTVCFKSKIANRALARPAVELEGDLPLKLESIEQVSEQEVHLHFTADNNGEPQTSRAGSVQCDFAEQGRISLPVVVR